MKIKKCGRPKKKQTVATGFRILLEKKDEFRKIVKQLIKTNGYDKT